MCFVLNWVWPVSSRHCIKSQQQLSRPSSFRADSWKCDIFICWYKKLELSPKAREKLKCDKIYTHLSSVSRLCSVRHADNVQYVYVRCWSSTCPLIILQLKGIVLAWDYVLLVKWWNCTLGPICFWVFFWSFHNCYGFVLQHLLTHTHGTLVTSTLVKISILTRILIDYVIKKSKSPIFGTDSFMLLCENWVGNGQKVTG